MPTSGGGVLTPVSGGVPGTVFPAGEAPLLPLETWRRLMGYNPYHFWGLANSIIPVTSACNTAVRQHSWQDADAAGREQIVEAILAAEERIREYMGFSVAPRYVEKTLNWPRFHDKNVWRFPPIDSDGRRIGVSLGEGEVQEVGIESLTLLGSVAVVYSDTDGDGLNDTFTASVGATVTDASQIAAYFATGDRLDGEGVSEKWRIKPVTVTISGGTVTVRGRSWILVKPILYEGATAVVLNPSTAGNFVGSLEIYQRTTSSNGELVTNSQGVLLWETTPCEGWFCCDDAITYTPTDSSNDPAAVGKAVARVGIRDAKTGIVLPAEAIRNATSGIWTEVNWYNYREPDRVTVRYLAGYPLDSNGQMSDTFQKIVARLAAAELGRRICACNEANQELYHWQFDLARAAGANDEQFRISFRDLDNPWGTRRGQVYAWRQVRNLRLQRGLALV